MHMHMQVRSSQRTHTDLLDEIGVALVEDAVDVRAAAQLGRGHLRAHALDVLLEVVSEALDHPARTHSTPYTRSLCRA